MQWLLLSFAAGLASACGFAPLGLLPVTLLAVAALLWLIETAPNLRGALARGWWFGFGQFVLGLNWIATSFTYQANMPAWLGWIAVVLLSLYLAVYPAVAAGLAWRWGRDRPLALVFVLAAAWIVTEWLRATMFTGFAWNPLGVVLIDNLLARWATLVGTYGLSALVILLAGCVFLLARSRWRQALALLASIAVPAGAMVMVSGPPPVATSIPIRIVQPNIGQEDKWKDGFGEANLEKLARLSGPFPEHPRLLLWPEAAVTFALEDGRTDPAYASSAAQTRRLVGRLIGERDLLLTGGLTIRSADGVSAMSATNSIFAMNASGRILARYDKAHLVPYGEYLPMRPLLSAFGLSRLAPGDVDFDPGKGPHTVRLPLVGKVGFQLCYEIIFSGQVVDRNDRPDFLFNPSNDAWFGAWGPPQHLAQARLRAIEEGLPVLRATPTGISAVVDADGRLLRSLDWRSEGFIDAQLPGPRRPTLFARAGNMMPMLFALLLAMAVIAVRRKAS